MGNNSIRVLLIDDHPAIAMAVESIIQEQMGMEVCGHALTAEQGLAMACKLRPSVAIVDVSLGDAHGLDLVQNLRIQVEEVAIVVFSMYDDKVYAERALRAGASGYLMKSEPVQSLITAIRTVADGDVYLSRSMASRILSRVALGRTSNPMFAIDELTDREMTVFQMLGEGIPIDGITNRLSLSRKTVETYRRRAKEKLSLDSIEELLQFAIEWNHSQAGTQKAGAVSAHV